MLPPGMANVQTALRQESHHARCARLTPAVSRLIANASGEARCFTPCSWRCGGIALSTACHSPMLPMGVAQPSRQPSQTCRHRAFKLLYETPDAFTDRTDSERRHDRCCLQARFANSRASSRLPTRGVAACKLSFRASAPVLEVKMARATRKFKGRLDITGQHVTDGRTSSPLPD